MDAVVLAETKITTDFQSSYRHIIIMPPKQYSCNEVLIWPTVSNIVIGRWSGRCSGFSANNDNGGGVVTNETDEADAVAVAVASIKLLELDGGVVTEETGGVDRLAAAGSAEVDVNDAVDAAELSAQICNRLAAICWSVGRFSSTNRT